MKMKQKNDGHDTEDQSLSQIQFEKASSSSKEEETTSLSLPTTKEEETTSLPTTKEILGEHLHHKVSFILRTIFPNSRESYENIQTVSKITGMLLERSEEWLKHLLADNDKLLEDVTQSLQCLEVNFLSSQPPSNDDLGDILYERVLEIDSNAAAQITGMLLEMDTVGLINLLSDDAMLLPAVAKATAALESHTEHSRVGTISHQ